MRTNWIVAATFGIFIATTPLIAANAQNADAPVVPTATTQSAAQFVQTLADVALNSINGKRLSNDETETRFRAILRQSFDVKSIGRYVLGPSWNTATDAEKADYQQAFENMIVSSYAMRFRDYSGGTFKAGKEVKQGKDTLVDSQIVQANGAPPINVTWRVRPIDNSWKIVDVAVEGVSMSATEKDEFHAVIDRNGGKIQPLIDAIKNNQIGTPE